MILLFFLGLDGTAEKTDVKMEQKPCKSHVYQQEYAVRQEKM